MCQAEKEIIHKILQGTDSKEYSKGLFTFDTPYIDKKDAIFEFGQGESHSLPECIEVSTHSPEPLNNVCVENNEIAEVSAQQNGAILSLPQGIYMFSLFKLPIPLYLD